MTPVLRTFLMWLLMLALPVQGIAASAMLHCGPSHQRQQAVAVAPVGEAHAIGDADHHAQHGHHAGHGAMDGLNEAGTDDTPSSPANAATCSACAHCCYATALVGSLPSLTVVRPDTTPEAALRPHIQVVTPGGLERPPRPSRA